MKAYGITFNNFTISNAWDLTQKYFLLEVNEQAKPNMLYTDFIVPNRHGSTTNKNRYEDKIVKIKVEVRGKSPIELASNVTLLLEKWINVNSRLFLHKRPNKFYNAQILEAIEQNETSKGTVELDITFKCSHCMYEVYGDLRDYTVDNLETTVNEMNIVVNKSFWSNITSNVIKQINNDGNFEAQPIIEVSGIATLLTMQIGNVAFSLSDINGTIFIDSEKMIVYKIDNDKKVSVLQQFRGNFPIVPVGNTDITIGGRGLDLSIAIEFKNTYIV